MHFSIEPKPPYNFRLSMEFLSGDNCGPVPYRFENCRFRQAFRIDGELVPANIKSDGTVDAPELLVRTADEAPERSLEEKICYFFNLNRGLSNLYEFMEKDPTLRKIRDELYGFKAPAMNSSIFSIIITAIVQQQISLNVAYHMLSLLVRSFGESVEFRGETYWAFPTPDSLADASTADLRECKLSRRKSEYITDFSQKVWDGDFDPESLRELDSEEVINVLTQFRGIGRWTAELVLATGLRRSDQVPADDLGVRNAVSRYYFDDERQDSETVREFLGDWNGFARDAVTYLLSALRKDIEI